jgi:hypothetical protein
VISLRKPEPIAGVSFDHWMLTFGSEQAGLRITRGTLDRHGCWHPWRLDVFLLWKGRRVG